MAGVETCDEALEKELLEAGIEVHKLPFVVANSEVPAKIIGSVAGWGFKRAWYYWVADGPGIPLEDATELHETHGQEVRVEGHCGCPSPKEWNKNFATGMYHVDSQEGLNALASMIRKIAAR
jgi:hypothetical protein